MGISERHREINRRRHRRKKLNKLAQQLKKANVSEKAAIAAKVRALTPGADKIMELWDLEKR